MNLGIDQSTKNIFDLTSGQRMAFEHNALAQLYKIDYTFSGDGIVNDDLQWQSKGLICALQAFDMLQAAGIQKNVTLFCRLK